MVQSKVGGQFSFFFFFTLVTGPRRSLSLKLSDTKVYEPQIRARLGKYLSDRLAHDLVGDLVGPRVDNLLWGVGGEGVGCGV